MINIGSPIIWDIVLISFILIGFAISFFISVKGSIYFLFFNLISFAIILLFSDSITILINEKLNNFLAKEARKLLPDVDLPIRAAVSIIGSIVIEALLFLVWFLLTNIIALILYIFIFKKLLKPLKPKLSGRFLSGTCGAASMVFLVIPVENFVTSGVFLTDNNKISYTSNDAIIIGGNKFIPKLNFRLRADAMFKFYKDFQNNKDNNKSWTDPIVYSTIIDDMDRAFKYIQTNNDKKDIANFIYQKISNKAQDIIPNNEDFDNIKPPNTDGKHKFKWDDIVAYLKENKVEKITVQVLENFIKKTAPNVTITEDEKNKITQLIVTLEIMAKLSKFSIAEDKIKKVQDLVDQFIEGVQLLPSQDPEKNRHYQEFVHYFS
ncbi:hypothetical protein [Spiroplasma endosymbiont of Crioceris asparagi]|uniref:hypothetical protein n=1 Tax=Spiroplasma endosymbiont of Crioceris asparagi TaxID=3066286 RepID=UPI0030CCC471